MHLKFSLTSPAGPSPSPSHTAMLTVPLSVSGIFILTAPTFAGALTAAPELHLPIGPVFQRPVSRFLCVPSPGPLQSHLLSRVYKAGAAATWGPAGPHTSRELLLASCDLPLLLAWIRPASSCSEILLVLYIPTQVLSPLRKFFPAPSLGLLCLFIHSTNIS